MTEVTALIEARAVTSEFQPVLRLDTGEIIGYEALARGPVGTRWQSPVELFCAAAAIGRTAELDWVCRVLATKTIVRSVPDPATTLFVNVDPSSLVTPCPADLRPAFAKVTGKIRIVLEISERALSANPLEVLTAVAAGRATGCGIAIDNVGGDPAALALVALIRPDVVKLDPYLLRRPGHSETARVVSAVCAYARQSGAVIVATGIETEEQLRFARGMGAQFGQGWLLGRAATLAPARHRVRTLLRPLSVGTRPSAGKFGTALRGRGAAARAGSATPYSIVTGHGPGGRMPTEMLLTVARRLERRAREEADPPVLLVCLPRPETVKVSTEWYPALAADAAFVALFCGAGLPAARGGVTGGVKPDDPLRDEWNVIVLGPHFAGAFVARAPVGGAGEGRMEYAVTFRRDVVVAAALSLVDRMTVDHMRLEGRAMGHGAHD